MKRWIVNAAERSVREQVTAKTSGRTFEEPLQPGEFLYDAPSYADAMAAGARRRLAEEALKAPLDWARVCALPEDFVIVSDRIESNRTDLAYVNDSIHDLSKALQMAHYDAWREGASLVVLGRLP